MNKDREKDTAKLLTYAFFTYPLSIYLFYKIILGIQKQNFYLENLSESSTFIISLSYASACGFVFSSAILSPWITKYIDKCEIIVPAKYISFYSQNKKWLILEKYDSYEKIERFLEKLQGSVEPSDIYDFYKSAILECENYYTGFDSNISYLLKKLYKKQNALLNYSKELSLLINKYRIQGKHISQSLTETQESLNKSITSLKESIRKLEAQEDRLISFFEKFNGYVEYLADKQNESRITQNIQKYIENEIEYTDIYSISHLNDLGLSFSQFSYEISSALNELNAEIISRTENSESIESAVTDYVSRTNSVVPRFENIND